MRRGDFTPFIEAFTHFVEPLVRAADSTDNAEMLLLELGYRLPGGTTVFRGLEDSIVSIFETVEILDEFDLSADVEEQLPVMLQLIVNVTSVIAESKGLGGSLQTAFLGSNYFNTAQDLEDFVGVLLDYLLARYLGVHHHRVHAVLKVLGVLREEKVDIGQTGSNYRTIQRFDWQSMTNILLDPVGTVSGSHFDAGRFKYLELLLLIQDLWTSFGLPADLQLPSTSLLMVLNQTQDLYDVPVLDDALALRLPLVPDLDAAPAILIYPLLNVTRDGFDGLGVGFQFGVEIELPLSEYATVTLAFDTSAADGLALQVRSGSGIRFVGDLVTGVQSASTHVKIGIALKELDPDDPLLSLGTEGTMLVEIGQWRGSIGIAFSGSLDFGIEFELLSCSFKLGGGKGDGFLQKILPPEGVGADFDLGIGWSSLDGLYFKGSAQLEINFPIHQSLGPLKIDSIYALLGVSGTGLKVAIGASVTLELGPIVASVRRIGIQSLVSFPDDNSGNAGPMNIARPSFLPPTGAGFAVDAGPISGGGFLDFDTKNERYSGIMALSLAEIAITAIGLITTKMPDGRKGFSILINIGVVFDPAIELSMGFTLSGVGGLVGINRAMVLDELKKGLRQGTLDSILFPDPKKVIANAQTIISDMRRVFPPNEGTFVIGPMVKLGWGSPNVIQADIGIFLVLPTLSDIALLGKLSAKFPEPSDAIVRINLHLLGTFSQPRKELTFQASIYDSEILGFKLYGDVAALLTWGSRPEFTMAFGGFHPKFKVPAPPDIFGGLKRMTLSVTWGSEIALLCQSYMALTPNSLQFGANVQIGVNVGVLSADGELGFDALFYFNPFSFEITALAIVNVSLGGVQLIDADIKCKLSGPTPWNANGSAKVRLLFIDITESFNITWGRSGGGYLDAIDPLPKVTAALRDNASWSVSLPNRQKMSATLQLMDGEPGEEPPLVVHPAGSLGVRQTVLPLGVRIEKFGNAPVTGHDYVKISGISSESNSLSISGAIKEHFARGEYEKLSDHAQLSKPSFEKMKAGVFAKTDLVRVNGSPIRRGGGYESVYFADAQRESEAGKTDWTVAKNLIKKGSLAKALAAGNNHYYALNPADVSVTDLSYCVAKVENCTIAHVFDDVIDGDSSRWHVEQVLANHLKTTPTDKNRYMVMPTFEAEAA